MPIGLSLGRFVTSRGHGVSLAASESAFLDLVCLESRSRFTSSLETSGHWAGRPIAANRPFFRCILTSTFFQAHSLSPTTGHRSAMFSWLASGPEPTATKVAAPVARSYDPLKGGKGASGFYTEEERPAGRFRRARGSSAVFYGSKAPPQGDGWPGAAEINELLRKSRSAIKDPDNKLPFRIVLGNEAADLDSIASAISYAFLLDQMPQDVPFCAIPVIAIPRQDLHLRTDVSWLLPDIGIDVNLLLFADEIDFPDLFKQNRLHLVLVDHNALSRPTKEQDLQNVIVEIIDHHKPEGLYPWVTKTTIASVGSCSTLVAEKISEGHPELFGNVALCRLLLGAIVTDTANFDPTAGRSDPRDEVMANLIISGAGSLGRTKFGELLQQKKFDQMSLTTAELLRRDYKQWALGPGTLPAATPKKGRNEVLNVGISAVGLPLAQLVGKDPNFLEEQRKFVGAQGLHVHVIMAMYTLPNSRKFKRELALLPGTDNLAAGVSSLAFFLQNEKHSLELKPISVKGLPSSARLFSQGKVLASRKEIQPLLAAFFNHGG
eukprot:TRINITY_DN26949_c0_g1_i1.p1 TRINITY_DN26949_c0_g1~~TRINITY_DN26949_c0_g1_i1.p1  ORF type:complete len:549 (-),score=85.06 TRINITY_DN26949_c0_g1_i1:808-2454(-)